MHHGISSIIPLSTVVLNASAERTIGTCDVCERTRMIIDANITQYAKGARLAALSVCGLCCESCVDTWSDEKVQSLILNKLKEKAAAPNGRL